MFCYQNSVGIVGVIDCLFLSYGLVHVIVVIRVGLLREGRNYLYSICIGHTIVSMNHLNVLICGNEESVLRHKTTDMYIVSEIKNRHHTEWTKPLPKVFKKTKTTFLIFNVGKWKFKLNVYKTITITITNKLNQKYCHTVLTLYNLH